MSQRTQNHIIEDESRHFFRGLLPKYWVYRDKNEDYGIDAEVEVFDEKGNPTGLVFWVQLKATASKDSRTVKSVTFQNDKIDQLKSYELPVLIVRYYPEKKLCYSRWVAGIIQLNRNAKSTRIYFYDEHLWNEGSPDKICRHLNRQTGIKRGNLRFPVKTFLKRAPSNEKIRIPYSRVIFLKNNLSNLPQYFSLTNDEEDSSLQIIIEETKLVFSISDLAFSTLGFGRVFIDSEDMEKVGSATLMAFCAALFELNRDDLASSLFFENDLFAIAKADHVYLARFLPNLLLGLYFSRTMELLCEHLSQQPQENNFLESVINMTILSRRGDYSEDELQLVENFLLLSLKLSEVPGNEYGRGISCYNLGNFYRGMGRLPEVLDYFFRAKRLKTDYRQQAYFLEEVANILFQLGKTYFAEQLFRKALSLTKEPGFMRAYIGDCLLFQGKYAEALNIFDEFLSDGHKTLEHLDEWSLKFTCLQTLLEHDYPREQHRNIALGIRYVGERKYDEAIEADMLNGWAWYQKGIELHSAEEPIAAFVAFLMVGIVRKDFVGAWVNATLIGFSNNNVDDLLMISVIRIAFYYNGQDYINMVSLTLKDSDHPDPDALLELMDKVLVKTHKTPAIIRFFDSDEQHDKFELEG